MAWYISAHHKSKLRTPKSYAPTDREPKVTTRRIKPLTVKPVLLRRVKVS